MTATKSKYFRGTPFGGRPARFACSSMTTSREGPCRAADFGGKVNRHDSAVQREQVGERPEHRHPLSVEDDIAVGINGDGPRDVAVDVNTKRTLWPRNNPHSRV